MSSIQLAFLGPAQLRRADQLVELKIAKAQALLAYLAVTGVAHSRDHLLNLFWAESHAEAARKNLRNHLWLIRQALGNDLLVSDGETIALAPTLWSDVQTFTKLAALPVTQLNGVQNEAEIEPTDWQTIIDLWRGPLLAGIKVTEAPDFELWLTGERQRLGNLYLQALEQIIGYHARGGQWQEVLVLAQRGLSHEPTHEAFHQQVMVAHARLGARSSALQHYDHLRRLLAAELNVEPMAATNTLQRAIAQGEIGPLAGEGATRTAAQPAIPTLDTTGSTPVAKTAFIGRQHELAVLDRAWQQTTGGSLRIIMLNGELGIGKTHLWQCWSARLPRSQTILATRCLNTTQALPYDPLARLLDRPVSRQQFARAATALFPIWRGELLRLAPTLQPEAANQASTPLLTPSGEPGRLAEALLQFLRSFQANPLILFIDDLHWADQATLDWLLYLSDRMADEPLLLIGAYRPEDTGDALQRLLAQWQRDGQLTRLALPHFTKAETTSLLQLIGGRVEMANHLHRQSSGNPYYLTQLSSVAVDGIPADLTELVRVRLQQLPATTQPIVQAAALLEPHIAVDILAHTTQQSPTEVINALDHLLAARVLVEREGSYEFTHPLVASVVRNGMNSGRRRLLHQRVAEELQTRHSRNLEVIAGQLAHHYAEAGLPKAAAGYFEIAGVQALHVAAVTEAAAFYRQAYQLDPTLDRQLGVGFALMYIPGALAEGRAMLQQVLCEAEARQDQYGIVRAGLWLAHGYLAHDEGDQVLYWTERILPHLATVRDPMLHAGAQCLLGTAKFRAGYPMSAAERHFMEATRLATEHQLAFDIVIMSWFQWGNLLLRRGDYPGACERFRMARRVAQADKSIWDEALSCNNLAYATLQTGDVVGAQAIIDEGLGLATTYTLFSVRHFLYSTRGEIALAAGRATEAIHWFQQALAEAEKQDNRVFVANVRANLGLAAQAQGQLDEALTLLQTARAALTDTSALYLQTQVDLWLVALHWRRAELPVATQYLAQAEQQSTLSEWHGLLEKAAHLRVLLRQGLPAE